MHLLVIVALQKATREVALDICETHLKGRNLAESASACQIEWMWDTGAISDVLLSCACVDTRLVERATIRAQAHFRLACHDGGMADVQVGITPNKKTEESSTPC